jgi:hypothetical protein
VRTRPDRIEIERVGGHAEETLRAEIDPTNMTPEVANAVGLLLLETRPPAPAGEPEAGRTSYDVVLHYPDRDQRLRYDGTELPPDVRGVLDGLVERGG